MIERFIDIKTEQIVEVIRPIEPEKWLVRRVKDGVTYFLDPEELKPLD